jgi:hypothetical protein
MDYEVMITVLYEVLAEQKAVRERSELIEKNTTLLMQTMERLDKKLESLPYEIRTIDLKSIESMVAKNTAEIKKILEEQPRSVTKVRKYLLFPEHQGAVFYDIMMKWIFYIVIASFAYVLLRELVDKLA